MSNIRLVLTTMCISQTCTKILISSDFQIKFVLHSQRIKTQQNIITVQNTYYLYTLSSQLHEMLMMASQLNSSAPMMENITTL